MKKFNLVYFMFLAAPLMSWADGAGNDAPGGGAGFVGQFKAFGTQIHRHLILSTDRGSCEAQINPVALLTKLNSVLVVPDYSDLRDKNNAPATATYDPNLKLIRLQIPRWKEEVSSDISVALLTVGHEYGRSMGLPEDFYNASGDCYSEGFFRKVAASNPNFAPYAASLSRAQETAKEQIALIDEELAKISAENQTDAALLKELLAKQAIASKATQKAMSSLANEMEEEFTNMPMIPGPFPSVRGRMAGGVGRLAAAGMGLRSPLSDEQIYQEQLTYVKENIRSNQEARKKLKERRLQIALGK